jgi:hypothetical protein
VRLPCSACSPVVAVVLGHDETPWSTGAREEFTWKFDGSVLAGRDAAKGLASKQRVTSVNLGTEAVDYTSDYSRAFNGEHLSVSETCAAH